MKKKSLRNLALLRQEAEHLLLNNTVNTTANSSLDAHKLAHELEISNIMLELQGEDLKKALEKANEASGKYNDLFDFIPSGYLILSHEAKILEINPNCARLLKTEPSEIIHTDFRKLVSSKYETVFKSYLRDLNKSKLRQSCVIEIVLDEKNPLHVSVDGIITKDEKSYLLQLKVIGDKINVEDKLLAQNSAMSRLNTFAIELSELALDDNLEELISQSLKIICDAELAIFSEYNSAARTISPKYIAIDSGLLKKVVDLLGKQISKVQSFVSDEMYKEISSEVIGIRESLHEVSLGAISKTVSSAIQSLLKADRFIGIAYMKDGKLYGTSVIAIKKGNPDPPADILKNIANLITLSLKRRDAGKSLKESEEKFRRLSELSVLGIYIIQDGKLVYMNPVVAEQLGYSRDELINKLNFLDLVHPEDVPLILKRLAERMKESPGRGNMQYRFLKKDGSTIIVEVYSLRIDHNGKPAVMGTLIDITERLKAAGILAESEGKFRNLVETTSDIIWETDMTGCFVYVNPRVEELLGYTPDEMIGRTPFDFMAASEGEKVKKISDKIIESKKPFSSLVNINIHKDGDERVFETSGVPVFDSGNNLTGYRGIDRDITERIRASKKLQEREEFNYALFYYNPVPTIIVDHQGKIIDLNQVQKEISGILPQIGDIMYKDYASKHKIDMYTKLLECINTGEVKEFPEMPYKENILSITISPFAKGAIITCIDITERKRTENLIQARLNIIEASAEKSLNSTLQQTLDEICKITSSPIGFYHFVEDNQLTISLQAWSTQTMSDYCTAEGFDRNYPLEKAGVWADCVRLRTPVIHNDYMNLAHRKNLPQGHAELVRELLVPIIRNNKVVAILGVGNKDRDYNQQDQDMASYFADMAWEIAERKLAELQLLEKINDLERFHKLTVGRELNMIGLKKEVNELLKNMGQKEKYKIVE